MSKTKDTYYFDMLVKLADYACQAALYLRENSSRFDPTLLEGQIEKMHAIEHKADLEKHEMQQRLMREFVTPIEGNDILTLMHALDNVTDAVEDVLRALYMYRITEILPRIPAFVEIICRSCHKTKEVMEEFKNFKRSKILPSLLAEINRLEEEGDRLYTQMMRELYVGKHDPVSVCAWTATVNCLENCLDTCEDVAKAVEGVIMSNN